ncbi:MAG: hypothetical protein QM703_15700 [Gemmatales bacterium]
MPTFFGEKNLAFELDLAATVSFGFFQQRAYGVVAPDDDESHRRRSQQIDRMMLKEMIVAGRKDFEAREYEQTHEEYRSLIDDRINAYRGWLVLQPTYRQELTGMKSKWQSHIDCIGRFPIYPRWPNIDQETGFECDAVFSAEVLTFYRRWGLDSLTTWDWPNPMEPDFNTQMLEDHQPLGQTGITLFIPWYLLRGERLDLQSFIQGSRMYHCEEHLRDWLEPQPSGKRSNTSDIRFRSIAWLYRYYFLALCNRYPESISRNVASLDEVLGQVLERSGESIKRLRQKIKRDTRADDCKH